jgi:DNA-binding NtrC family response regulator
MIIYHGGLFMKVLVVDDDGNTLNETVSALDLSGYEVSGLSHAVEAFELYKSGKFDVVITDYHMPEMTGLDLLKKIKEFNQDSFIIIITGYAELETAVEAVNNHAYAFFVKPVNLSELIRVLKSIEEKINKGNAKTDDINALVTENIKLKNEYNKLLNMVNGLRDYIIPDNLKKKE